jgi:hypothetical protein
VSDAEHLELQLLLAPVHAALQRLPAEARQPIETALAAARPVLELAAAQAIAAEQRADYAAAAAELAGTRADRIERGIDDALRREQRRWESAMEAICAPDASADQLVRALSLEGPVADEASFHAYMLDDELPLRLGPSNRVRKGTVDAADRLSLIAKRCGTAPRDAAATSQLLQRCASATTLANAGSCGACVDAPTGQAVLLGDGTAVSPDGTTLVRAPHSNSPLRAFSAQRWADGRPPVLVPSARAAVAATLALRAASSPPEGTWAASALFGAAIRPQPGGATSPVDLAKAVWRAARAVGDSAGSFAAACFELAYLTMRVTVAPAGEPVSLDSSEDLVDVGRIRWCELTGQALTWLPLQERDPDDVGGADRPWTSEPPAAGATWWSEPPSLRLAPDWYASVLFDLETAELLVLAPDETWWTLDTDFEGIALARRQHVDPWLRAIEVLEDEFPEQIEKARSLPPRTKRRAVKDEPPSDDTPPARFSKDWILERAERYGYADDSVARAAGARAARAGAYSRDDFLTIVRWKSARALPRAERNTAASVSTATRASFAAKDELSRIAAMTGLEGVGVPVASALLHFAFPDAYPILDFRALASLGESTTMTQYSPSFWARYVERCRDLAKDAGVSLRDLDKALWQDSKHSS